MKKCIMKRNWCTCRNKSPYEKISLIDARNTLFQTWTFNVILEYSFSYYGNWLLWFQILYNLFVLNTFSNESVNNGNSKVLFNHWNGHAYSIKFDWLPCYYHSKCILLISHMMQYDTCLIQTFQRNICIFLL